MSTINIIPEKNKFFLDITQAFCFFCIFKKQTNSQKTIVVNPKVISQCDFENDAISLQMENIKQVSDSWPIIGSTKIGWDIIKKIETNKKLKTFNSLSNLRGELDLTLDKKYITNNITTFKLLRGNNIDEFCFSESKEYVDEDFIIKAKNKSKYVLAERLVCQQISNINTEKRVKFTKVPNSFILANSCNFIAINQSDDLFEKRVLRTNYLLGLLNSVLIDWRFKQTNSNNHISNYELGELPIAYPTLKQEEEVISLAVSLVSTPNKNILLELNTKVFEIYGLDSSERNYILQFYKTYFKSWDTI